MFFNHKNKKEDLRNLNLLDLIPAGLVDHVMDPDGKAELLVPKFRNEKFARWFIPGWKSRFYKLHLDENGTRVWLSMNGLKSVMEICNELNGPIGQDATDRISSYFLELYQAGCVDFRRPGETNLT
jgi:hypothetical protein